MSKSLKFNREEAEEGQELMSAALYIEAAGEGEEEDDRPPQDGMAYLRQVIRERKRVPETVSVEYVGKAKSSKLSGEVPGLGEREKVAAPPGWCPGPAWQREQVRQFSEVRLKVARHAELARQSGEAGHGVHNVPDKRNEALWCHMMLGGEAWSQVTRSREGGEEEEGKARTEVLGEEPGLNFMVSVPGHVCARVLDYLLSWLPLTGWTRQYGPWLYALLVRIEKPLEPEVGSSLRDLVLLCARERRRLAASGEEYAEETIAALNLLICLVAKYFGQGDLEDREDE